MTAPQPAGDSAVRTFDLRGLPITAVLPQAEAAIQAASAGETVVVLADHDVVVKYVTPTAATRGLRCRFGPPQDGVWRIDIAPRAPRPVRAEDAAAGNGGNE